MRKFILFLFAILYLESSAQNEIIDSLRQVLMNAKNDTARISAYVELTFAADDDKAVSYSDTAQRLIRALMPTADGKMKTALNVYLSDAIYWKSMYFSNAESYDTAIQFLNEAMKPALAAQNKKQEARILNDLGVCYYHKNDIAATIDYFKKSLVIREELKDDMELRNAYNNMAFIYKETGFIDNSLELNFKALALSEKRNSDDEIANSLNNIGQVYHKYLRDYDKGIEYYRKALAIREKMRDKKGTGLLKNNIGGMYSDRGMYTEAIPWHKESLALRKEINYKYGIINSLSNLGYNYIKIQDYDKARQALAESMELNKILQDNNLQASAHRYYAELYQDLNKTDSAVYHAKLAHKINLVFGNPLNISVSAELLSGLYEETGAYKESLSFYKLYKTMRDSILNDNLKKAGIKSELEYQYLKKKIESDKVYNEQLVRKNLYTWLFVVLFLISVIIAFILYKRYQLKQKLKEVELRNKIASDLHDDVGSTLSSIRMYSGIVSNQIKETNPASIELLDKISNNSKEMIENMSDIVWMIKPGNDEFKNIENRMLNFANELCTSAGINFEFSKDPSVDSLQISMEQRRDIYLIFKEAVNNAVKYSGCHSIRTGIGLQQHKLQLLISDDGIGFNTSLLKKGNGLSNMQKRAEAHKGIFTIHSEKNEGTEIMVSFPV